MLVVSLLTRSSISATTIGFGLLGSLSFKLFQELLNQFVFLAHMPDQGQLALGDKRTLDALEGILVGQALGNLLVEVLRAVVVIQGSGIEQSLMANPTIEGLCLAE